MNTKAGLKNVHNLWKTEFNDTKEQKKKKKAVVCLCTVEETPITLWHKMK